MNIILNCGFALSLTALCVVNFWLSIANALMYAPGESEESRHISRWMVYLSVIVWTFGCFILAVWAWLIAFGLVRAVPPYLFLSFFIVCFSVFVTGLKITPKYFNKE